MAKESLPEIPFFLFDLDKATNLEDGEGAAKDFLKETFFTNFEKQREAKVKSVGGAAMARHGTQQQLRQMIRDSPEKVIAYLKTLSPSGTELEIMSLTTYDFKEGAEDENMVSPIVQTNL